MDNIYLLVEKRPTGEEGKFVKLIIGVFSEAQVEKAYYSDGSTNRNLIKIPANQLLKDGIIL